MANVQTLLVGVDFSPYSRVVARQALKLAKHLRARIVFAHIYNDLPIFEDRIFQELRKKYVIHFKNQIERIYGPSGIVRDVETVVRFGRPDEELIELAKNYTAPLIIVGHKGKNMLERAFLGSVAEKLALSSPVPVWIHRGNSVNLPRKFVLPYDLQNPVDQSLKWLNGFFKVQASSIELLNVHRPIAPFLDYEDWEAAEKRLRAAEERQIEKAKTRYRNFKFKRIEGDPSTEINKEAKHFDLVVMSHNKKAKHQYFGSVSARVVRSGSIPVLITPIK